MSRFSAPAGIWSCTATACVAVGVIAPFTGVVILVPGMQRLTRLTPASGMIVFLVCLAAAVLLHLHWRLTRADSTGLLCSAAALLAVQGLTLSAVERRLPSGDMGAYFTAANLTAGLLLVSLTWLLRDFRFAARLDPLGVGLSTGALLAAAHLAVAVTDSGWRHPPVLDGVGMVALVACGVGLALGLRHISDLPPWAQLRFQAAVVLLFARQALALTERSSSVNLPVAQVAELVAGFVVAVLLASTSLALLRLGIRDDQRMVGALRTRLADLEEDTRTDRARMHEVMGSIAGIASAAELMSSASGVSADDRPELERMVAHESSRLHRMLHDAHSTRPVTVVLEEVLRPLVVGHRAQGHAVRWEPDDRQVTVAPDALAQAVSVLLANAARHAPGSVIDIRVSDEPGWVAIRVSDSGPGVCAEVAGSLFTWGTRAADSPGSGIGLHLARRLLLEGGGRLIHDPGHRPGASFVIGVRPARPPLLDRGDR